MGDIVAYLAQRFSPQKGGGGVFFAENVSYVVDGVGVERWLPSVFCALLRHFCALFRGVLAIAVLPPGRALTAGDGLPPGFLSLEFCFLVCYFHYAPLGVNYPQSAGDLFAGARSGALGGRGGVGARLKGIGNWLQL